MVLLLNSKLEAHYYCVLAGQVTDGVPREIVRGDQFWDQALGLSLGFEIGHPQAVVQKDGRL